jgi:hypothetical protein
MIFTVKHRIALKTDSMMMKYLLKGIYDVKTERLHSTARLNQYHSGDCGSYMLCQAGHALLDGLFV